MEGGEDLARKLGKAFLAFVRCLGFFVFADVRTKIWHPQDGAIVKTDAGDYLARKWEETRPGGPGTLLT